MSALGLGILVSMAAHNEFQVMQFIPLVIAPQVILGGVFLDVQELPTWHEVVARVMPLTYVLEGMNCIVLSGGDVADFWVAVAVLAAWTVGSVVAGALAVRSGG